MSHIKNKIEWCLKKAEKELIAGKKHKGLIKIKPDINKATKPYQALGKRKADYFPCNDFKTKK